MSDDSNGGEKPKRNPHRKKGGRKLGLVVRPLTESRRRDIEDVMSKFLPPQAGEEQGDGEKGKQPTEVE